MTKSARLTIGEVARQSGFSRSALRYYESIGLLAAPERASGRRRYAAAVLDQLALIRAGQAVAMTLDQIAVLFHGFPKRTPASTRWKRLASAKLAQLDAQAQRIDRMRELLRHLERCQCDDLETCAGKMRELATAEAG